MKTTATIEQLSDGTLSFTCESEAWTPGEPKTEGYVVAIQRLSVALDEIGSKWYAEWLAEREART